MKLKVVGCGDAFGSGGRGNSCFLLTTEAHTVTLDFGASALVNLHRFNLGSADIDTVFISHLHGDHFGGIPFLLLDGQYVHLRERPLAIVGPPGTQARLAAAMEVLFPGMGEIDWRFAWKVTEVEPGSTTSHGALTLTTAAVVHPSGAPSTALRLEDGTRTLAFSGDTQWTQALLPIAHGADLFICESFAFEGEPYGHLAYRTLADRRADLGARRILLTHMGDEMWARRGEVDTTHFIVAEDGLELDI
ncbi:MBL fold metallo-hydrolase [Xanthobacter autotrophicus]|uniref:MBL fold metallo-hydrolase n=1 Tax=Xanthobacter autotrophicus TaxID=280 RepID=UPI0024A6AD36|nr:MBL fold metallo-hydrolase [Xanthobacter autotrophicus]MDI4659080.1 MBL fold metallo-hydrolase [Xanthobacter autotrophicus]